MFQQWINNLQAAIKPEGETDRYWFERLSALLLFEISRADHEIDESELAAVSTALKASCSSIDAAEIEQIISEARRDAEATVSFRDHVRQINKGCTREQKIELIEQMWRVAYADGDLDKYEEYTIRKLSDLLYVEHQDFIKAKLRIAGD
jgi:uncharacterized tellurite resistance protein B-like protein